MPVFDSTNFENKGNTDNDIHLNNAEDVCESIINLSSTALRNIKIFTPDLEQQLYNCDYFRKNILNFVRGNRHAQIQVLVSNSELAVKQGHQLIRLSQQLTSAITIKITPEEYQHPNISFMLIDQKYFIFKPNYAQPNALNSSCKFRADKLNDFFILSWEQAKKDPCTLNLHL